MNDLFIDLDVFDVFDREYFFLPCFSLFYIVLHCFSRHMTSLIWMKSLKKMFSLMNLSLSLAIAPDILLLDKILVRFASIDESAKIPFH